MSQYKILQFKFNQSAHKQDLLSLSLQDNPVDYQQNALSDTWN